MRRFSLNFISIMFLLITSLLAGDTDNFPAGKHFHPTLFGMICALPPGRRAQELSLQRPRRLTREELPGSVSDSLKIAHQLVDEGGFDYTQVFNLTRPRLEVSVNDPSALLQAYKNILEDNSIDGVRGLLRIVPICLAYSKRPEEALSASALAVCIDKPGSTELRAAGRAFCIILQRCIDSEELSRKEIIKEAIESCGAESIRDALRIVLTDATIDEASIRVADTLAMTVRAWYDSDSYLDALNRLGRHATPSRKALTGALAGASYGLQDVVQECWPEASLAGELDALARQLVDLAGDGILLPVDEADAVRLAELNQGKSTQKNNPGLDIIAPVPPAAPVAPVAPAAPIPPVIIPPVAPVPPIPPKEPEPSIPTSKDFLLFPQSNRP